MHACFYPKFNFVRFFAVFVHKIVILFFCLFFLVLFGLKIDTYYGMVRMPHLAPFVALRNGVLVLLLQTALHVLFIGRYELVY